MNLKEQTINTYNKSADALASKFDEIGARKEDIDFVFSKTTKQNPLVVEIGCGNGRDAKEICEHTNNYLGIDISEKLIAIAQENLPDQKFLLADVENFEFPKNIDIVFAFASLIHVPKESFRNILEKLQLVLHEGGLVFISLKHSDTYKQVTKEDEFGVRTYWHYSEQDIKDISSGFEIKHTSITDLRGQIWMEVLLKKK